MPEPLSPAEPSARPAPWVLDGLLGIGVTLIVSLFIASDIQASEPAGWAYLWAVGLGGLMFVRRRYPVLVLLLSAAGVFSYYALGFPAIGVAVPLAAAVFSAAENGRAVAAVVVSAAVLMGSTGYRLATGQDPSVVAGYELPGHLLMLGAAIALGDSVRSRRELWAKTSQVAALTVERYTRQAEQSAMTERLALARELHDSVGHALTVIALHNQIAEEALDPGHGRPTDEETAREALRVVAKTTSSTFEELRRTVSGLRREDRVDRRPLRINDLESAILPARQAGLDVRTSVEVDSPLPSGVEAAVYRIVQESVTNVVRHADAARVEVAISQAGGSVEISVVNDDSPGGNGRLGSPDSAGSGLDGMRERAHLLGGTFSAGHREGGFAVRASIPLKVTA